MVSGMSLLSVVESGDKQQLAERLAEFRDKSASKELSERNQHGHSPLDLAAILGHHQLLQLLLDHGADLNATNKSGYTAFHYSAAWGHPFCLQVLIDKGADCRNLSRYNETAKDMAKRYGHLECVSILDYYEQWSKLKRAISEARSILADNERKSGKWNKEEKSKVAMLCNEKSDWLEKKRAETNLDEIQQQIEEFEMKFQPFITKLA